MKNSFQELIKSHPLVLVDFSAEWCGPCKMLAPILKETKDSVGDKVKILKIDVDKNPTLAKNFEVMGVPTLILFKNGHKVWRQSGMIAKHDLVSLINNHA